MVHDDPRSIWKGSEDQKTRTVGQEGAVIAVRSENKWCKKLRNEKSVLFEINGKVRTC